MTTEILSILIPLAVTDAALTSTTVPENDYPVWTAGATFAAGDFCISPVTHRIYQSQVAGNTGKDPTLAANRASVGTIPVYWVDYDATNRWAMLDDQASTQTAGASPLTVVLHPGGFNAFWAGGLDAESLTYTVKDAPGGNVIRTGTSSLEASAPGDYDEYFFAPFRPQTDFLVSGIDQYSNAELTLTLTKSSGLVKIGMLAVGDLQPFGATLRGVKVKPKTYSFIDTDGFGRTKIVPGKAATDIDVSARIDLSEAAHVGGLLRSVLDVPVVIVAASADVYSDLRTFGLVSGEIDYDQPTSCLLTLTAKGMI
jgi:hypothetical protein